MGINPCKHPSGWLGRFVLWSMNARHSSVTDWGLTHIEIGKRDLVLDVGCGGGRTVQKLAAMASEGKVVGVDHARDAVTFARRLNRESIAAGRAEICEGTVSQLPFPDGRFDVVTAVETHFWWPDLPAGMREVWRVLKPGGKAIVIAEVYKGSAAKTAEIMERELPKRGLKLLTVEQHRELFAGAGFGAVEVWVEERKGWICCVGKA